MIQGHFNEKFSSKNSSKVCIKFLFHFSHLPLLEREREREKKDSKREKRKTVREREK